MKHTIFLSLLIGVVSPAWAQPELLASWTGEEAGEQFGIALAIGGDANQDGWADVAVGSSASDLGGESSGKVSIYLGRSQPLSDPDLVLAGDPGTFFGAAVAWAGDVNGDGYDDLLVGAYRDSTQGTLAGKACLYLGGDPMDAVPDLVLFGPGPGAYFGRAVGGAVDLNSDGHADFAVGAPRTTAGTVYVYFGGQTLDDVPDLVIDGQEEGDRFGTSLAGPGNVDGVAGDDLLVGASRVSITHTWQGAAYLFSGGAGLDGLADWELIGVGAGDQFGSSVAAAGDVNGDGAADLILGAPYVNVAAWTDAGAAYICFGGPILDDVVDFILQGSQTEDYLGRWVAGCGDVTGSGYGHVVAGAPGNDGNDATGYVVISPGGNPPQQQDLVVLTGENQGDHFGYAVAGAAGLGTLSFSGDGRPDIAIGAWSHGIGGKSYIYGVPGSPSGVSGAGLARSGGPRLDVDIRPSPGRAFTLIVRPAGRGVRIGNDASCWILDPTGAITRRLQLSSRADGSAVAFWDGRTSGGWRAAPGAYVFRVSTAAGLEATGTLRLVR